MKNNTLKALGIAIGAAMSVMLASDMEVHAAEVYDAESGKIVESVGCGSDDQEEAEEDMTWDTTAGGEWQDGETDGLHSYV